MGAKPRLLYAEFAAAQHQEVRRTVAWVIDRFIREMNGLDGKPPVKSLGTSHEFTLRRLCRSPIGSISAPELHKSHVIEHCKMRQAVGTNPATVMQDITYITGALRYAGSAWDGCEDISDAAIAAAKPFLKKHNLVAKSKPRDRRPTPEEIELLLAHFSKPPKKNAKNRIDMVRMTLWQWYSARRIGESCALLWADWNQQDQTILVRKVKARSGGHVAAMTNQAQQFLIALWEIRDQSEPRIFPYLKKSVGAAYTRAKKELGIVDLRMHDSRRDRGTRLVEDDGCTPAQAICYTLHGSTKEYERTYLRQDPAKIVRQVNEKLAA